MKSLEQGGPLRAKGAFCKYFSSYNYSPFYENNCSENTLFIFVKICHFNFEKAIVHPPPQTTSTGLEMTKHIFLVVFY